MDVHDTRVTQREKYRKKSSRRRGREEGLLVPSLARTDILKTPKPSVGKF